MLRNAVYIMTFDYFEDNIYNEKRKETYMNIAKKTLNNYIIDVETQLVKRNKKDFKISNVSDGNIEDLFEILDNNKVDRHTLNASTFIINQFKQKIEDGLSNVINNHNGNLFIVLNLERSQANVVVYHQESLIFDKKTYLNITITEELNKQHPILKHIIFFIILDIFETFNFN